MRKLIILLLITIMSVGCSKLKEKSSDNTLEDSQASSKQTLQIDDVEGYWECRSSEDDILLRIGWKNDIDIYYSDNSKENKFCPCTSILFFSTYCLRIFHKIVKSSESILFNA